jgi:hypothetical protein
MAKLQKGVANMLASLLASRSLASARAPISNGTTTLRAKSQLDARVRLVLLPSSSAQILARTVVTLRNHVMVDRKMTDDIASRRNLEIAQTRRWDTDRDVHRRDFFFLSFFEFFPGPAGFYYITTSNL